MDFRDFLIDSDEEKEFIERIDNVYKYDDEDFKEDNSQAAGYYLEVVNLGPKGAADKTPAGKR